MPKHMFVVRHETADAVRDHTRRTLANMLAVVQLIMSTYKYIYFCISK